MVAETGRLAEVFDYVVVGAGTAGALLANRLSADPGVRVLLLEAGRDDAYHWIHIPVGYLYCIGNPRTDWCFATESDAGLNGRSLRYPRGKVLGGCSSINGMIYMRGQARDYDRWAALTGDDSWCWDRVLHAFKAHEDHWRLDAHVSWPAGAGAAQDDPAVDREAFARFHGHHTRKTDRAQISGGSETGQAHKHSGGGEWRVEKQRLKWEILDAFARAAQEAGIPATDDFNRGDNEGVSYFEVNQRSGWRWNTAKAFLRPARARSNLQIRTEAQVERLLLEKREDGGLRCSGVRVWRGGTATDIRANRAVVLSAGSIGSPHILMLSGIGKPETLRAHGIEPAAALPGVGANLQDHLQIRSIYKVQGVRTLNTRAASLLGKTGIGLEYLLHRRGPMSMAPSQLGAFTRSSSAYPHANIQYHVQPLSLEAFGEPLHRFDAFTASVCNLNPSSRGQLVLKSADFRTPLGIQPNYLSTDEDRQVAADSLRITRRIVSQPAMQPYRPEEYKPGVQFQSDEDLIRLAGDIGTTIFHPVGTCRMGRIDDPDAVVDSRLRVLDGKGGIIAGLHVADASVMPTITSGNTNSPTLMIAEKAAAWISQAR